MFPAVKVGVVMNVHTRGLPSATPVASFAAVVIVAVTALSPGRRLVGVNVAVVPEQVTVPATGASPC